MRGILAGSHDCPCETFNLTVLDGVSNGHHRSGDVTRTCRQENQVSLNTPLEAPAS
jgi:hypothetical protein